MTFAVQEQLLLALLFDKALREDFSKDPAAILAQLDFTGDEKNDFLAIRLDGLAFDASLRIDLILSQMTRHFPISFALLSSFTGGLDMLQSLIDLDFIDAHPADRPVQLGSRLRDALPGLQYVSSREYQLVNAIIEAELGMALTGARLRQDVASQQCPAKTVAAITPDWLCLPVSLAPYVSAAIIPLPYAQMKQAFCPCEGAPLWRSLHTSPLAAARRQEMLQQFDARLLLAQAYISHASPCEPSVDFSTVELAEGFAPLFQYVDGESSVADILAQLQQAGAEAAMLESIRSRFRQLLEIGMLRVGAV